MKKLKKLAITTVSATALTVAGLVPLASAQPMATTTQSSSSSSSEVITALSYKKSTSQWSKQYGVHGSRESSQSSQVQAASYSKVASSQSSSSTSSSSPARSGGQAHHTHAPTAHNWSHGHNWHHHHNDLIDLDADVELLDNGDLLDAEVDLNIGSGHRHHGGLLDLDLDLDLL